MIAWGTGEIGQYWKKGGAGGLTLGNSDPMMDERERKRERGEGEREGWRRERGGRERCRVVV